jgi:hypothetical protein
MAQFNPEFKIKKGTGNCLFPLKIVKKTILPFGELKPGPGTFLAVFFAFFDPGITFDEPGPFEREAEIGVNANQRPCNSVPHGTGLTGNAAADHRRSDIIAAKCIGKFKRLNHLFTGGLNWEVVLHRTVVDDDFTAARLYPCS